MYRKTPIPPTTRSATIRSHPGTPPCPSGVGVGTGVAEGDGTGVGAGVGVATAARGTTTSLNGLPSVITLGVDVLSQDRSPSLTSAVTTYVTAGSTSATLKGTENGIGALAPGWGRASKPSTAPVSGCTIIVTDELAAHRATAC